MYDSLRSWTAGSDVTADTTSDSFQVNTSPVGLPLVCRVVLSSTRTGTTPTLDITLQESDDGSTWYDLVKFRQVTSAWPASVPAILRRRFHTRRKYVRANLDVGGTTPNFGKPTIEIGFADSHRDNQGETAS